MKRSLVFFLMLTGCSSFQPKTFSEKLDCSPESNSYASKMMTPNIYHDVNVISAKMKAVADDVKVCYQAELDRSFDKEPFYACLTVGFDKKGQLEFSQFSAMRHETDSEEFKNCLTQIPVQKHLHGLRSVKILQAFSFTSNIL